MSEYACHQSLRLENFTVFADAELEFAPGINAFIGENGSGKTHLLKAMYAYQRPFSREIPTLKTTLEQLFQTKNAADIIRSSTRRGARMETQGVYGGTLWAYGVQKTGGEPTIVDTGKLNMGRPVFIPAADMMGHTLQFTQAYNQMYLDFDLTYYDIVTLFSLENKRNGERQEPALALSDLLGGKLELDNGRFYLQTMRGRQAMPLVAEGIRKIAALARLLDNGWLTPPATLFWDEPEVNINPVLMDNVIQALLTLARQGVQVFLTTHSYVILKELELQASAEDSVRYFSLHTTKSGTKVTAAEELAALVPNPIARHYAALYDRDLDRALGKGRSNGSM